MPGKTHAPKTISIPVSLAGARLSRSSSLAAQRPKYRYLSDYDKKNAFDVERYMKRRPAIVKPDEPFDCYEISEENLQED